MTHSVRCLASAKINLSLRLVGKRADGYHLLESIVAFAGYGDEILVSPAAELTLSVEGPFANALMNEPDNLVLRAARLLRDHAGREEGAHILLRKNLPVASGIGGGSADAAATLLALNALWALGYTRESLAGLGEQLGADVPMCVHGKAAFVAGIGEQVTPFKSFPTAWVIMVNPLLPVSTPAVFKARSGSFARAQGIPDIPQTAEYLATLLGSLPNDLEGPALQIEPAIIGVLDTLRRAGGSLLQRMSGSGATCFALVENQREAETICTAIQAARPDWWCVAAPLDSSGFQPL